MVVLAILKARRESGRLATPLRERGGGGGNGCQLPCRECLCRRRPSAHAGQRNPANAHRHPFGFLHAVSSRSDSGTRLLPAYRRISTVNLVCAISTSLAGSSFADAVTAPAQISTKEVTMETAIHDAEIDTALAEPANAQDGHEDEQELSAEIRTLWSAHNEAQAAAKQSKEELRAIPLELGRRLSEVKERVSRPGRGGRWTAFLAAHAIPRATGDRLVGRYAKTLGPQGNRLSEAISEPAKPTAEKMATDVWQSLKGVLATGESVVEFIGCIAKLSGVAHERRQEGLMIFNPVPEAADGLAGSASPQSAPAPQPSDGGDAGERAEEAASTPTVEQVAGAGEVNSGEVQ